MPRNINVTEIPSDSVIIKKSELQKLLRECIYWEDERNMWMHNKMLADKRIKELEEELDNTLEQYKLIT